jgi:hypothetical protein
MFLAFIHFALIVESLRYQLTGTDLG